MSEDEGGMNVGGRGWWDPEARHFTRGQRAFDFYDCVCKRVTPSEKALVIEMDDGEVEVFPTSQIWFMSDVQDEDDKGILSISPWIAEMKGLIIK